MHSADPVRSPTNSLLEALEQSGLHDESKDLHRTVKAWEQAPRPKTDSERDYGAKAQAAEEVESKLNALKKHGLTQQQVNALSDSILHD